MANQALINKLDELEAEIIADELQDDANEAFVISYKKDATVAWIVASAIFFEMSAPQQDLTITVVNNSTELVSNPYLTRLHNAFSAQAKIVTITCTDGVNV